MINDILNSGANIAGIATLGIGGPILFLYLRGVLPTVSQDREKSAQIEWLKSQLDEKDKIIKERDDYNRQLVKDAFAQQESVQQITATLATFAQQLPVLVYAIQQMTQKRSDGG